MRKLAKLAFKTTEGIGGSKYDGGFHILQSELLGVFDGSTFTDVAENFSRYHEILFAQYFANLSF